MKISKPDCLDLIVRPYQWRGRARIGLTVIVCVDHSQLKPQLCTDAQLWELARTELDSAGVLDLGIPKPHPEFLVSGYGYTHFQDDKTQCLVSVQVNNKQKELLLIGDRYVLDKKVSKPQPFEQMPITWANAFGGSEYENNPHGKGATPVEMNGVKTHFMPNVESPHDLITDIRKKSNQPYGFGMRELSWPVRFKKIGTYSEHWRKHEFPGFLPDMDPCFFNSAADDQVWTELNYFPNQVDFAVRHMHPQKAVWQGEIPTFKARCLVDLKADEQSEPQTYNAELKLKTLWLVPHLQSYFLIYQDSIPAFANDGNDIDHVLAALEWSFSAKPLEHYSEYMEQREDHDESALLAYEDALLLPEAIHTKGRDAEEFPLTLLWNKQEKLKRYIRQHADESLKKINVNLNDFVPEFVGPEEPLNMSNLQERQAKIKSGSLQLSQRMQEMKEAAKRFKLSKGKDKEFLQLTNAHALQEKILQEQEELPTPMDPPLSPAMQVMLEQREEQAPKLEADQKKLERKGYIMSAHYRQDQYVVDALVAKTLRGQVIERIQSSQELSGLDFDGADLSDLRFEDIDFSLSALVHCDLSGAQFIRCRFYETAFVDSDFQRAQFTQCQFEHCNFSDTYIEQAQFEDCRFSQEMIEKTVMAQCRFLRCHWQDFILQECTIEQSQFTEGSVLSVALTDSTLKHCHFGHSSLERMAFTQTRLEAVDFTDSSLLRMVAVNSELEQCHFSGSHLEALTIVGSNPVIDCSFSQAQFRACGLRQLQFIACDFSHAYIENSDFSKSIFKQVNMRACQTPEAVFMRGQFSQVDFSQANLMKAIFTSASFDECVFVQTNLFRADFSLCNIRPTTLEQNNYMVQTQVEPRYEDSTS